MVSEQSAGGAVSTPQQTVVQSPVQPRLASRIIASTVDRLFENVGVIAAKPPDFLSHAILKAGHQIIVAAIPQRTTTCQIAFHTDAVGFDDVLAVGLGVERRRLAVPIDDLRLLACRVHTNDNEQPACRPLRRRFDRPFLRVAEAQATVVWALDGVETAATAQAAPARAEASSIRDSGLAPC
jgi:hypothetical protein